MSTSLRFVLALAVVALCGCGKTVGVNIEALRPVPEVYRASFETSRGSFVIEVTKSWAPEGAERFYRLLQQRFYDDARFFRVVRNFVVQFGINGNPAVEARWRDMTFADDPVKQSNLRGTITFATSGPNTRTTQVFINLKDNAQLDKRGFAPFGKVVEGMEVVDRLHNGYGDSPPRGEGPDQTLIETQGNAYLESKFQMLDYVKRARILEGTAP
ncbi:MAG: peptidylprolyl isomerase [Bryobacteraceae bacterium]|jgi:peptidyl-prolyl cis-trans isomerase A (cyclophilin A)